MISIEKIERKPLQKVLGIEPRTFRCFKKWGEKSIQGILDPNPNPTPKTPNITFIDCKDELVEECPRKNGLCTFQKVWSI
jgi:hypothetical protein